MKYTVTIANSEKGWEARRWCFANIGTPEQPNPNWSWDCDHALGEPIIETFKFKNCKDATLVALKWA